MHEDNIKYDWTSEEVRVNAKEKRAQRRAYLQKLKAQPCTDCGKCYPFYVMDFDHVSGEKVDNIAHMLNTSWLKLQIELAKCDLVCANCHRERTHQRETN